MLERLREQLAELEHEQWIEWSRNLHEKETLSPPRIKRWGELWKPYTELTEAEKDQDRVWADKIIAEILKHLESLTDEEVRSKITDEIKIVQISSFAVEELHLPKGKQFKHLQRIRRSHAVSIMSLISPLILKAKEEGRKEVVELLDTVYTVFWDNHEPPCRHIVIAEPKWQSLKGEK